MPGSPQTQLWGHWAVLGLGTSQGSDPTANPGALGGRASKGDPWDVLGMLQAQSLWWEQGSAPLTAPLSMGRSHPPPQPSLPSQFQLHLGWMPGTHPSCTIRDRGMGWAPSLPSTGDLNQDVLSPQQSQGTFPSTGTSKKNNKLGDLHRAWL